MTENKKKFEDHLKKLKSDYSKQLPAKIDALITEWKNLQEEPSQEKISTLHRNVHSIIGTSGTFGFTAISKKARELETTLKSVEKIELLSPPQTTTIALLFNELYTLTQPQFENKSPENEPITLDDEKYEEITNDSISTSTNTQLPVIYYLDDDIASSIVLTENLAAYGFNAKHFSNIDDLLKSIEKEPPHLALFDLVMPDLEEHKVFEFIHVLTQKNIKVFIYSSKTDFHSRLAAVRSGASAYLLKPADMPALINLIRNELNLNIQKKAQILIIDDQESILEYYNTLLVAAGLGVAFTNNPLEILEKLEQHRPDLILLDINMPLVSGYEVAAVIRQFEEYQSIPILFLSAEVNSEKKTSLLEIGSDDLLSKGMPPLEFVRQIRSRVERAKILSSFMFEDSLTGLLNHAQIQLAAERALANTKRYHRHCCLVMIDIDNFKNVNDTYGHQTGDKVLKALSQLLQQRLRITDSVGRYGGEEFMLVLPDTGIQEAGKVVNDLRKAFCAIEFIENKHVFTTSFSAGVAESNPDEGIARLIQRADSALYKSKTNGKNRVCMHFQ